MRVRDSGRARSATSCDWSAAGGDETGGGRVRRKGELVCCRRRLCGRRRPFGEAGCRRRTCGRRRLSALGGAGEREASTCYCSAAGVGKTGGVSSGRASCGAGCRRRLCGLRCLCKFEGAAGKGGAHLFLFRRRYRQDRRRVLEAGIVRGGLPAASAWPAALLQVGGGGGQGRRSVVFISPPSSARTVARARGGHRAGKVAAGVCVAGGTCACQGGQPAREALP